MRKKLLATALVVTLASAGLLAGCSGSINKASSGEPAALDNSGESAAVAPQQDSAKKPVAQGADGDKSGAGANSSGGESKNVGRAPIRDRSIIRVGQLVVRTANPQAAADKASALVSGTDGYVSSRSSSSDPGKEVPTSVLLVLRIPVDQFDQVRSSIRQYGKVLADKQDAKDVTDELVDVESRVKSQQRSIERLRILMGKAKTVGEVIQVESELSTREADLESLQSRQATLASQSSLSTLTVTFEQPPAKVKPKPKKEDEGGFFVGLRNGWNALTATAEALLLVLGALLPFLVVLVVIGGPLGWYTLRIRRRRRPQTQPEPELSA